MRAISSIKDEDPIVLLATVAVALQRVRGRARRLGGERTDSLIATVPSQSQSSLSRCRMVRAWRWTAGVHVLADHEAEFGDLGVAEVVAKFADEAFVDTDGAVALGTP